MLYVSRILDKGKYGITDTTDGIETVVSFADIQKCVRLGLEIKGVEALVDRDFGVYTILGIYVCLDTVDSEAQRTKSIILKGIDVQTINGGIRSVMWTKPSLKSDTTIRLSDFGRYCEGAILSSIPRDGNVVTVILDDKIRINKSNFQKVFYKTRVKFDLRDVTKFQTAACIYSEYIHNCSSSLPDMLDRIIDNQHRHNVWSGVWITFFGGVKTWTDETPVDYEVAKIFRREFHQIAEMELMLRSRLADSNDLWKYIHRIEEDSVFWRSNCSDYMKVLEKDAYESLLIGRQYFELNHNLGRMIQFLKNFKPDDALKSDYVLLCNRINNFLLDYGSPP